MLIAQKYALFDLRENSALDVFLLLFLFILRHNDGGYQYLSNGEIESFLQKFNLNLADDIINWAYISTDQ